MPPLHPTSSTKKGEFAGRSVSHTRAVSVPRGDREVIGLI
jgi:hypothetical protein